MVFRSEKRPFSNDHQSHRFVFRLSFLMSHSFEFSRLEVKCHNWISLLSQVFSKLAPKIWHLKYSEWRIEVNSKVYKLEHSSQLTESSCQHLFSNLKSCTDFEIHHKILFGFVCPFFMSTSFGSYPFLMSLESNCLLSSCISTKNYSKLQFVSLSKNLSV